MILVTKIQSISDIVTNSSSEVFLMTKDAAIEFQRDHSCDGCLDVYFLNSKEDVDDYWYILDDCLMTKDDLIGYAIVSIEDHYDYDQWESDCNDADNVAIFRTSNR